MLLPAWQALCIGCMPGLAHLSIPPPSSAASKAWRLVRRQRVARQQQLLDGRAGRHVRQALPQRLPVLRTRPSVSCACRPSRHQACPQQRCQASPGQECHHSHTERAARLQRRTLWRRLSEAYSTARSSLSATCSRARALLRSWPCSVAFCTFVGEPWKAYRARHASLQTPGRPAGWLNACASALPCAWGTDAVIL